MSESLTDGETLILNVTFDALKQWLLGYYMSQHPENEPGVWSTFGSGEVHLSYHAPPDGRISFVIKVVSPEKLIITRISFRENWENYCHDLVEALRLKWASNYSLPKSQQKLTRGRTSSMNLQVLRDKISNSFNLPELKDLCFNLDITYEDLPGSTRAEKTRELVEFCDRHGRLPELLAQCRTLRPHKSWHEVAELDQQLAPQIREDKLTFLCWVYIKSKGNILQPVQSDDIATVMKLDQQKIVSIAQFLNQKSLIKFDSWYIGMRITHTGLVKAEHDIVEGGFLSDDFPPNITTNIGEIQQKRFDFLHCLYRKSNGSSFESVSGIEIANTLSLDYRQLASQGVLHYLKEEGWLNFGGAPNVRITEMGVEKVESEMVINDIG